MPQHDIRWWLSKFKDKKYEVGVCNCKDCVQQDIGMHLVEEALMDLHGMSFIPRLYNPDLNFLRREVEPSHHGMYTTGQFQVILQTLNARYVNNGARMSSPEYVLCDDCGRSYLPREGVQTKYGHSICKSCFRNHYLRCNHCHEIVYKLRSVQIDEEDERGGYKRICFPCFDKHHASCNSCGKVMVGGTGHNIDDLLGNRADMFHFQTMGDLELNFQSGSWEYAPDAEVVRVPKKPIVLCDHCKGRDIVNCARCRKQSYRPNMSRVIINHATGEHGTVCPDCRDAMQVIKRYDYCINPKWLTSQHEPTRIKDGLFFGVEIEVEAIETEHPMDEHGRRILDWWGNDDMYIKHDGSLDAGFEIVSHPFTWKHYQDNFEKWTEYIQFIKREGFSATYFSLHRRACTCGFHVHMSKNAFSHMHLYKFVNFFYKASVRPFITGIAGRTSNRYAKFEPDDYKNIIQLSKDKRNASGKRYSAINLMGGHAYEHGNAKECNTVEVRVFGGSLEPFIFHKNLEFLQSLYEFTLWRSPKEMLVRKYIEFLMLKPNNWKCLLDYIKYDETINKSYSYVSQILKGV